LVQILKTKNKLKTMKTIKIILATLLISASSFAQTSKTAEQKAAEQTEKMKTELGLTAEQTERVKEVNYGIVQKNEGVRNSTMTDAQKKESITYNEEARDNMMKDILTAEQFEKYKAYKAEKAGMKGNVKMDVNKTTVKPLNAAPSKN